MTELTDGFSIHQCFLYQNTIYCINSKTAIFQFTDYSTFVSILLLERALSHTYIQSMYIYTIDIVYIYNINAYFYTFYVIFLIAFSIFFLSLIFSYLIIMCFAVVFFTQIYCDFLYCFNLSMYNFFTFGTVLPLVFHYFFCINF